MTENGFIHSDIVTMTRANQMNMHTVQLFASMQRALKVTQWDYLHKILVILAT